MKKATTGKTAINRKERVSKKGSSRTSEPVRSRTTVKKKASGQMAKKTSSKKNSSNLQDSSRKKITKSAAVTKKSIKKTPSRTTKTASEKTTTRAQKKGILEDDFQEHETDYTLELDDDWNFTADSFPRAVPPGGRKRSDTDAESFTSAPKNKSRDPLEMDASIRNWMSDMVMILLETRDYARLEQILDEYTAFIGDMNLLLKSHRKV